MVMKRKSEEAIMSASKPRDLFSMNPDTLEEEKDEYLERFKPTAYNAIRNFMVTQKVTIMYRQALSEIVNRHDKSFDDLSLTITQLNGRTTEYYCHYVYDIKIGKMYVAEDDIIFVLSREYEKYYKNYIDKTKKIPKLNREVWKRTEYCFPKLSRYFETANGDWVIIVKKPCKIYPLREILNYFGGKIAPEYVASILTRLYNFECYIDIIGMTHNGITVDNLFFAPGRTIEEGEDYTVEDMRIVGVFGGWFFTTWEHENLKGVPKDVFELLPKDSKVSGYSSFKVDALSIKRVARELLGDSSGENLSNVPVAFEKWVNNTDIRESAYHEYCAWEKIIIQSFGKHRFVEMDVSID